MSHHRTPLEAAAGQLISAIQHEWGAETGEPSAVISEEVMHSAHALLRAAKGGSIACIVASGSVSEFLGKQWVQEHPRVWPHIQAFEALASAGSDEGSS